METVSRKKFCGGNWKCNNTLAQSKELVETIFNGLQFDSNKVDVVFAPVFLHLAPLQSVLTNKNVQISAQNCSNEGYGAFTGEISSLHLKDLGLNWVILGHSERRTLYGETDELIAKKCKTAIKNGLKVIFCIGETLDEFEKNITLSVLQRQLEALRGVIEPANWNDIVIAYEPVWAIGTGKVATPEIAQSCHEYIRNWVATNVEKNISTSIRIIYGGSANEKNCFDLIAKPDIDGFLVGGASLKPGFAKIIESCNNQIQNIIRLKEIHKKHVSVLT